MTNKTILACGAVALLAACGESDETLTTSSAESEVGTAEASQPTFWADIAPILNEKCSSCHQAGGIAPFALDNYADAAQWAPLAAAMTASRVMPPYLMQVGGECGSFDEGDALTDEQIALIGEWANSERLEGTPAPMTPRQPFHLTEGVDVSTPEFTPAIEGGALAQFDEYRCFPIDPGLEEEAYITGFEFQPGNTRLVHHVIAMLVDPSAPSYVDGQSNAQVMAGLDQQDPARAGWHCFGEAGEGVAVEGALGGWAPGTDPYVFPEGIGVRVQPGRRLVLQVHYNMADPSVIGQSDQTRGRLQVRPSVERQAVMLLADSFLGTLGNDRPDVLEPGSPNARYSWTRSAGDLGIPPGVPAEALFVAPHMHGRGRKYTLEVGRDGAFDCQGHIERWDFNWQRLYHYTTPLPIDASSAIRVTCEYDTTGDTQPVLPGWGTQNEMCELNMMLAFPPGVQF
jgi:hypothetical protein